MRAFGKKLNGIEVLVMCALVGSIALAGFVYIGMAVGQFASRFSRSKTALSAGNTTLPFEASKTTIPEHSESALNRSEAISANELVVKGHTIKAGETNADEVFAILGPSDEIGDVQEEEDPSSPNSLYVVHAYSVGKQNFSLGFHRTTRDGPYVVANIAVLGKRAP